MNKKTKQIEQQIVSAFLAAAAQALPDQQFKTKLLTELSLKGKGKKAFSFWHLFPVGVVIASVVMVSLSFPLKPVQLVTNVSLSEVVSDTDSAGGKAMTGYYYQGNTDTAGRETNRREYSLPQLEKLIAELISILLPRR